MSPTSRWSRNWTPFTTRPSRTSRQGMILAAGNANRLRQLEPLLPQGLADNDGGRGEGLEIVERGDAARRLHREVGKALYRLGEQIQIGPAHHPVAADVRDQ